MLEEVSQFCVNPMEMPVTAWWRPLDIYVFYQAGYRKLTSLQCANIDVVKKTCSQLNWSIVWSPRKPSELSSIPAKRPKYIKPRQWFDGVLALHKMTAMRFKIDHYHSWDCIAVPWNVLLDVQLLPGLTVNVSDSIRVSVQQTTLVCLIALSIVPLACFLWWIAGTKSCVMDIWCVSFQELLDKYVSWISWVSFIATWQQQHNFQW